MKKRMYSRSLKKESNSFKFQSFEGCKINFSLNRKLNKKNKFRITSTTTKLSLGMNSETEVIAHGVLGLRKYPIN